MKKLIVRSELWDDSDYVITIRPEKAKNYQAIPIGGVFSKHEAEKLARWLQFNIETIQKLTIQTEQDSNV